jgi:hypothetical protein
MSESNIQASPGSIFICYRREDSADVTGRIYDRLADHYGPERVFMDVEAIRLGYDFRSEIDQTIKVCSIGIVVIGDKWLADVDGKRRIDDENDRVRIEIESALRREIPIIPVLTRGASHPTKAMLPASLEDLAYRHGTSIRHEHFHGDMDSLITQMEKLLARHETTPSKSAEPKEPTPPMKSTQTTQSQPAIPPVASVSAIAASKEPAVWTRKRLITVTAVAAMVILLLLVTITLLLTGPHPSLTTPHPSDKPSAENDENGQGVAKIELTSTPSGARIFEGDKPIGTTPFHGELPSGEATLVFMVDGYLPRELKAALAPKKLFKAEVALAKPAAIYQGTVYAPGERERPLSVKLGDDLKSGTMTYGSRRGDFVVKFTGLWNGTIMHGVTGEVVSQPPGIRWTPESFTLRFAENGVTATYECTADNKTYIANLSAR